MMRAAGCASDRGLIWTQIESAEGDLVLLQVTIPTSSDDIILSLSLSLYIYIYMYINIFICDLVLLQVTIPRPHSQTRGLALSSDDVSERYNLGLCDT
jgi:hypothetical protein